MRPRSNLSLACCFLTLLAICYGNGSVSAKDPDALEMYNSKKFLSAAKAFTGLIESEKGGKDPVNYFNLGNCYYQLSYPTRARHMYALTMKKFPENKEAEYAKQMIARIDSQSAITQPEKNLTSSKLVKLENKTSASAQNYSTSGTSADSATTDSELARLPQSNTIYFDLDPDSGHMMVDIYLNGRKMQAIFDTGASAHFGANHLRAAGVEVPRGKFDAYTSGWANKKVPIWVRKMPVRIGNLERTLPVTIEENMTLRPLVGQAFLKGYEYEIHSNSARKFLVMKKRSNQGSSYANTGKSDLYDVPCVTRNLREYVIMKVNGKDLEVLLDTGAYRSILSDAAARRLGIRVPDDAPTTVGVGVGGQVVYKQVPVDIKIGPIYERNFMIKVGGGGDLSAIGQDLLSKKRYTIDRKNKLLRFFH